MKIKFSLENYFRYWLFGKLVSKNHRQLTKKTFYFSVFLDDLISDAIQINQIFEGETLIPLFDILSKKFDLKNNVAIDVGANIGNHTIFFSDFFYKVLSFEPNPITYKLLSINTFFLQNVEIHNIGLSDTKKEVNLSVVKGNIGASSASVDYKSGVNHRIKLNRLDDWAKNIIGNISLIKIDVEGMEHQVLIGGENTVKSHLPIILFEQWISSFENGKSLTITHLKNLGYNFYKLTESHTSRSKLVQRLKRIPLIITRRSLIYSLQKVNEILPNDYAMIIAIHSSKDVSND